MSRLDRHVAFVQSKLAFGRFLAALAMTTLAFCAAVWLGVLMDRFFQLHPPRAMVFVWAGLGAAVLGAFIYSLLRKPTAHEAAVAIDERLGLKEKFSTALFARHESDPFAVAAVRDAERAADNVSLSKQFPLTFPPLGYWTVGAAIVLLMTAWFFPTFDLFGKKEQRTKMAAVQAERDIAKRKAESALATVNAIPKDLQSQEAIQMAKRDLEKLLSQPITDPAQANRTAFKALEQSNEALKEEVKKNEKFAMAQASQKMLRSMSPPSDEQGPVADAQRDIAKGNFTKAMDELNQVAQKFEKMSDEEQKKATQQMEKVAREIQKLAQDPQQMKQLQKQLENQGMNQQQAQDLTQKMQQAAQGDKEAQKQLQQMQQQAMQQMQQQGASPQQQAKAEQLMKQMQAQSQSQATAQQMAQAAQQMAKAMQQASTKQGNQQNSNSQGQMAQAQQQMQQAMAQMEAVQKDAESMTAAQNATQQATDDAANQAQEGQGQGADKPGQGIAGRGAGQWKPGDPRGKKGQGQGGPGIGNGGGIGKEEAPYAIKKEAAPVQDIENGKILASTFVKAGTIKGESKVQLSKVVEAAMKDATDEVEEESVSKESQKVVKDYFETMQKGD